MVLNDPKRFINTYGSGIISNFLHIRTPFSKSSPGNLLQAAPLTLAAYAATVEMIEKQFQFAIYPKQGGLFPFGKSDNGDDLYWITAPTPSKYPIFVEGSRGSAYEIHQLQLTTFLHRLLSGELTRKSSPLKICSRPLFSSTSRSPGKTINGLRLDLPSSLFGTECGSK